MEFRRNQVIVATLVFMIAIAGYLSLTDNNQRLNEPQLSAQGESLEPIVTEENLAEHNDFFDPLNEMATLAPDAYNEDGKPLTEEELAALGEELGEQQVVEAGVVEPTQVGGEVIITKKSVTLANSEQVVATDEDTAKAVEVSYFAEEKMLREQARAAQIEKLTEFVADENMDKDSKAKAAQSLLLIQERIEKENGAESLLRAKGFKDVFVRMDEDTVDVVVSDQELSDEEIAQIEEIVGRKTGFSVGQIKISTLNNTKDVAANE